MLRLAAGMLGTSSLLLACNSGPDLGDCESDKCDDADVTVVETCTVMASFGTEGLLESAYDFTPDGDNRANPSLAAIQITRTSDGELAIQAGAVQSNAVTRTEGVTDFDDFPFRSYAIDTDELGGGPLELQIFDDNQVGMLSRERNGFQSQFAELDCNPTNAPHGKAIEARCEGAAEDAGGTCRTPDGRFAPRRCCETAVGQAPELDIAADKFDCTVVVYDDSSIFDSAVGTPYTDTEPGHWEVEFGTSDFSDRADKLRFDFGGLSMDEDADEFTFVGETKGASVERTISTWTFARADDDDPIEIRIFSDSGMGLMTAPEDGEAKVQLDCRATFEEPEELF